MNASEGRLAGKVCIVTGAGSGIGEATAEVFAQHGAKGVVCADIDGQHAEATAERLRSQGFDASPLAVDIADADDATALIEHTLGLYGSVDVLHNNAGIVALGAVHEVDIAAWDRCIEVNLRGTFLVTRAALRPMLEQQRGAIVNTCSTFATAAAPQLAAYNASKGAIRSLTRQMARDYSPDIRVNSVSPGLVDTAATRGGAASAPNGDEIWEMLVQSNRYYGRAAEPREIAHAVLFLASDEASFITGHDLALSGGQGEVAF
ncbi:MAG TPA: glucose 1-dehydrogenase [Solirubrobacteraceae bacterium]|nr:glucose 1-dehydrogenase [Solirubrobacteraceae bacterium]